MKIQVKAPQHNPDIINISGVSGMTRSGRIYTPEGFSGGKSREEEEERARRGKNKEPEPTDGSTGKKTLS